MAGVALIVAVAAIAAIAVTLVFRDRSPGPSPLAVTSVSVSVTPATGHCPQALFAFRGEIKTNGGAGKLSFIWQRPDGTDGPTQSRRVPAGTDIDVETLQFTFTGSGSTTGAAALHVVSPANVYSAPVPVRYQCP